MELLEGEQIKKIPEYDNYYISSFGRVYSIKSNRWLKQNLRGDKKINSLYLCVSLSQNGNSKSFSVHRLVAENFLENPNNYNQVNHKDENKYNNHADNLEWCDNKYNMTYGDRIIKSIETKKEHGFIKAVWQCDKITHEKIRKFDTASDAAEFLTGKRKRGCSIGLVARGERQSALGYYWEYD